MSKDKSFKFYVPIDLIKAEQEANDESLDSWKIQGIASTGDEDLQGEQVDQEGLDISVLKAGRGIFNMDHKPGIENVLGQIEDADFITKDGKKALVVKGYLFKHQERSKAFFNVLRSIKKGAGPRVHMSIEGRIMQRDMANTKCIKKARVDKVALTLDPVNPYTYAELVKSLNSPQVEEEVVEQQSQVEEFIDVNQNQLDIILNTLEKAKTPVGKKISKLMGEGVPQKQAIATALEMKRRGRLTAEGGYKRVEKSDDNEIVSLAKADLEELVELTQKALAAGAAGSKPPMALSSGEATTKEDLEHSEDPKSTSYKAPKMRNGVKSNRKMIKSFLESLKKAHPDSDPLELAEWAINAFIDKYEGEVND